MQTIVTVEKVERKTVLQLYCGHWVKIEGTATPQIGQQVICPKCGK